jgi:hypothetical protein
LLGGDGCRFLLGECDLNRMFRRPHFEFLGLLLLRSSSRRDSCYRLVC